MLKPLVAIDLDGVLADFVGGYLKIARKLFHKPPKGFVWDAWDPKFVTKEENNRVWNTIKHTRNWWMTLEKLDNTNSLMRRQKEMNLFFLTMRVPTEGLSVMEQSQEWLWKQFAILGAYVAVTEEKGKECEALDIEYFVDDKDSNCLDVVEHSPKTKVFILDQPYNKSFKHKEVERVGNLNEFIKRILGTKE